MRIIVNTFRFCQNNKCSLSCGDCEKVLRDILNSLKIDYIIESGEEG